MKIKIDDLSSPVIHDFLRAHLDSMALYSPPESIHALDVDALRRPEITFWSVWEDADLMGCGALKRLDAQHGEIKSMRTAPSHRRKGVARHLLQHLLDHARQHGYQRISLETGSTPDFEAAQKLYASFGFSYCEPFADYREDPFSVFMTKVLEP